MDFCNGRATPGLQTRERPAERNLNLLELKGIEKIEKGGLYRFLTPRHVRPGRSDRQEGFQNEMTVRTPNAFQGDELKSFSDNLSFRHSVV